MLRLTFLGLCIALVAGNAVDLTVENFEEQVFKSGKNAIVKFYAPWCGHCKSMAPAWKQLGAEYEGSSSVLIGDVDATVHGELATKYGIQGYPTIKYFTQESGTEPKDYKSGRDFESLNTFVKENLLVKCQVSDPADCTEKEKAFITKMKDLGSDEIAKQYARLEGMKGKSMKADLKQWWGQRLNILKQLKEE